MANNKPVVYYLEGVEELRTRISALDTFTDETEAKSYYPLNLSHLIFLLNHPNSEGGAWPTHLIIGDELKPLSEKQLKRAGELINIKPEDFDYFPEGVVKLVREMARVKKQKAPEVCLFTDGLYNKPEMKKGDAKPHLKYDEEVKAKELGILYKDKNDPNSLDNILNWISNEKQPEHQTVPIGDEPR